MLMVIAVEALETLETKHQLNTDDNQSTQDSFFGGIRECGLESGMSMDHVGAGMA
jgi:hypothetical protein